MRIHLVLPFVVVALAQPVAAQAPVAAPPLQAQVEQVLAKAPQGTRFGVLVVADDGAVLAARDADGRYVPASNAKIFVTAAAYALLPGIDAPDDAGGASVALEGEDVVLAGHGDARLSAAPDCVDDCLATLADAVAAKTRTVRDVIGDDRWFPDQRFPSGMSRDNLVTVSGAGISALSLDDNALTVRAKGAREGQVPEVALSPWQPLLNEAMTSAQAPAALAVERVPGEDAVRLFGRIGPGQVWATGLGVADPAHFAAWTLRAMLEARGVRVTGCVRTRHRGEVLADDPARRGADPLPQVVETPPLARLRPPPLSADVIVTNKHSQNLHAELLLRRIGRLGGTGSVQDGLAAVREVMDRAGVPRMGYDLADGSGMSTYDRASPRAIVTLLRWIAAQPWGAAWRASLPVGGVDGTLKRRFAGTAGQGAVFAKTGTLYGANALSGHARTASGREVTFAILANDAPEGASMTRLIDELVLAIIAAG